MAARNARNTIEETIASLRAQTLTGWEAIIVDDGSTDGTGDVVAALAGSDGRMRLLRRKRRGVSAARNAGLASAAGESVLFLDADDLLEPRALKVLWEALQRDAALVAVYGIWTRVSGDGARVLTEDRGAEGDIFPLLAKRPLFAIHACLVRRAVVVRAGGFDCGLSIGEDWELWQRISRAGGRFGSVAERVARYRIRPESASSDGARLYRAGATLIDRAHRPLAEIPEIQAEHGPGRPAEEAQAARLHLMAWCAGLEIARGHDARELLSQRATRPVPGLDIPSIVSSLHMALAVSHGQPPDVWLPDDPVLLQRIRDFITALEDHASTPGLARQAGRLLDRQVLRILSPARPITIGALHAEQVDVCAELRDVVPPARAEHIEFLVRCGEDILGSVELPVCDGLVPAEVIADAIADRFWWELLGRFFGATVYRQLLVADDQGGWTLRRCGRMLASVPPSEPAAALAAAHEPAGWTVLLQELWNRPNWPVERFYLADPAGLDGAHPTRAPVGGWIVLEVGDEPFDVEAEGELDAVLTAGGMLVGAVGVAVPPRIGRLSSTAIRSALITATGMELGRVAVREGVLGRPLAAGGSLRERLLEAAMERSAQAPPSGNARLEASAHEPGPGWSSALRRARVGRPPTLLLARRAGPAGTGASRRAALPAAAAPELALAAAAAGEPVLGRSAPERAAYVPELLSRSARRPNPPRSGAEPTPAPMPVRGTDRHVFETLFAGGTDPWDYESAYELEKCEQTLSLLPPRRIRRALEIGCAEGHITTRLAPRVASLVAADVSHIALTRAAARCRNQPEVSFMAMDIARGTPPGRFDLILCSEVLYYLADREQLADTVRRLAGALEAGGHLLCTHGNVLVDDPEGPGFDWTVPFGGKAIGEVLRATPSLRMVHELKTSYYRIQLVRREPGRRRLLGPRERAARVTEVAVTSPPAEAARWFRPGGGQVSEPAAGTEIATARLPILAYHRVAENGPAGLASFRLSPARFEEQLDYLSEAGFRTVSLEQWRLAAEARRPIEGRAVVLTFDDGYRDFLTHAWPALERRGLNAMVFLVTDNVGRTSLWDDGFGQPAPLLDWSEIAELDREGVTFGSHGATHLPLTSLTPTDVTRELARSRHTLQEHLGRRVDSMAYPYGNLDPVTAHLAGACGYTYALGLRRDTCSFISPLLELPRIEIRSEMSLPEFVVALG